MSTTNTGGEGAKVLYQMGWAMSVCPHCGDSREDKKVEKDGTINCPLCKTRYKVELVSKP